MLGEGNHRVALLVRRVRKTGADVLLGQVRIIVNNLLVCHTGSEPSEHVTDSDTDPTNARLPAAFTGFDGYDFVVVHKHKSNVGCLHYCPVLTTTRLHPSLNQA